MGKQSSFAVVREWIGGIAFRVFLWAYNMTNEEYLAEVYEEAAREYKSAKANDWMMK